MSAKHLWSDKERERVLEKQRKELHKRERNELREEKAREMASETGEESETVVSSSPPPPPPQAPAAPIVLTQPRVSNVLAHDISHREPVSLCASHMNMVFNKCYTSIKRLTCIPYIYVKSKGDWKSEKYL